jgi:hypothetical protein
MGAELMRKVLGDDSAFGCVGTFSRNVIDTIKND